MILTQPKKQISLPKLLLKTQKVFNEFIRERDQDKGCISCGAQVTEAGHYFSAGHHSAMRFNEVNTNGQCTRCNCFLSGNLINYRIGLIRRYGESKVLMLENAMGLSGIKKWSRCELLAIIQEYKSRLACL
jgi:Bacteriophage Lambda NinG protein